MNTRIDRQRLGCFEIVSSGIGDGRSLKLIAALMLCLGITGWAQVPGVPFAPSAVGRPTPVTDVSHSQLPLPTNALALKQRMRQSPTSTEVERSSAAARVAAVKADSVQYSYIYINIPNSTFVQPNAINNAGLVVGWYLDSSYNYHGFIWQNGTTQFVDYPGALQTSLLGVNNQGQMIGTYEDASFNIHVATYSPSGSSWSDLPAIPGGWQVYLSTSISLNDEGEALGCAASDTLGFVELTWIWHPASQRYAYLTAAAAAPGQTCGQAMNDLLTVVGVADTAYGSSVQNNFPFLFVGNELTGYQIAPLPSSPERVDLYTPLGLNNLGTVAGTLAFSSDNSVVGFVRNRDGVFSIVNDTAWTQTYLTGVNDFGVVIGDVYDPATGLSPGFVAYPQRR